MIRSQIDAFLQDFFWKPFKKFKMPRFGGIEYLRKRNLEKAAMRGSTDFKTNIRDYYYCDACTICNILSNICDI